MTHANTLHGKDVTDMLADYLNGHLTENDRAYVERALEGDTSLRQQLDFERRLQSALRAESELLESDAKDETEVGFTAIEGRLRTSSGLFGWLGLTPQRQWLAAGVPAAALAVLVVLSMQTPPIDELVLDGEIRAYDTLFDESAEYEQPTLRVLFRAPLAETALLELLSEHNLMPASNEQSGSMLEFVAAGEEADLTVIAQTLAQDERVLATKVMGRE